MTIDEEKDIQVEATNKLLLQMVKNQKENNNNTLHKDLNINIFDN